MNARDVDRLSELANIGAGHAATALARLTGRTVWTRVPVVKAMPDADSPDRSERDSATRGVFFDLDGCVGGVVGVLFRPQQGNAVARRVLGVTGGEVETERLRSALCEVGNILVSHLASAIADTLGEKLVPSPPTLAMDHAQAEISGLCERRGGEHPIRIDCELSDEAGELGSLLVVIPDAPAES
jgi:chemotaxis protein CheC